MRTIFTMLKELLAVATELNEALAPLAGGQAAPRAARRSGQRHSTPRKKTATKKPTRTTKSRARTSPVANPAQVKHGRYMGLIRRLSKTDQAAMKKIRLEQNVDAAIAFAEAKKQAK